MVDKVRNPQMATFFWNAYSNIQSQVQPLGGYDYNRELLTYIQADERYVSYIEDYATAQGLQGAARDRLIADARATHAESSRTLDTSPGYSTDMQGLANDFYFTIEQSYENAPRPVAAAPAAAEVATPAAVASTPVVESPAVAAPAVEAATPVYTPMGDVAMGPAVSETAPAAAATTTEIVTPAVTTAMGDVAIPETVVTAPVTPAAPQTPAYDPAFTAQQLGSLGATPAAGVTQTPTTTPIAAADMPVPQPNVAPTEPARPQEDQRTTYGYTVERGDNLWNIAREQYGLTKPRDIQRAVDYIAQLNNMGEGTNANRISIGQELQLPTSPTPPAQTPSLDWQALDADTRGTLRSTFRGSAEGAAVAPTPTASIETAPVTPAPAARPLAASIP